jgi:xylose isomerase
MAMQQSQEPLYGAGLWHFAQYRDRYATDGYGPHVTTLQAVERAGQVGSLSVVDITYPFDPPDLDVDELAQALKSNGLRAIAVTPEIYTRHFRRGAFTNPDAQIRADAIALVSDAANVARTLGCDYVKLWPGQDGWDYPFQANYRTLWTLSVEAVRELAQRFTQQRFAIEYKPREPRNRMVFSSAARTLLAIEQMEVPNVGVLLDFGHALYGGESPAESAQMLIDRDRLYAIDVNDNFRGWDDDMVVGSISLVETLEFFCTLQANQWKGVWQLDQFPFREDAVEAARAGVQTMRAIWRALQVVDMEGLADAQARQDALAARRIALRAFGGELAEI